MVFYYSGRVKSPGWRWQWRRANLRHSEIFRHTSLPAEGTYYPICTFPSSSECLIGISDAFSAFCLRVSIIFPTCSLYTQQKRAYSALHLQAWTYIYRSMPEGSYRVQSPGFPKIVYWLPRLIKVQFASGAKNKFAAFPRRNRTQISFAVSWKKLLGWNFLPFNCSSRAFGG